MTLEELLNVMMGCEQIDIWVDITKDIDAKTTIELFDEFSVSEVKNSLKYETIKNLQVWFVGRTFCNTIEIRILENEKGE